MFRFILLPKFAVQKVTKIKVQIIWITFRAAGCSLNIAARFSYSSDHRPSELLRLRRPGAFCSNWDSACI